MTDTFIVEKYSKEDLAWKRVYTCYTKWLAVRKMDFDFFGDDTSYRVRKGDEIIAERKRNALE
jgi:hypothetical protein